MFWGLQGQLDDILLQTQRIKRMIDDGVREKENNNKRFFYLSVVRRACPELQDTDSAQDKAGGRLGELYKRLVKRKGVRLLG